MSEITEKKTKAAKLAHEIRTPMAKTLGYAEVLLMDDKWDDEAREYVSRIVETVRQLDKKLNELSNLIKE